jgi:hypothetical protein
MGYFEVSVVCSKVAVAYFESSSSAPRKGGGEVLLVFGDGDRFSDTY